MWLARGLATRLPAGERASVQGIVALRGWVADLLRLNREAKGKLDRRAGGCGAACRCWSLSLCATDPRFAVLTRNPYRTRQSRMFLSGEFWRRGLRTASGQEGGRGVQRGDVPAQPAMKDVTEGYEGDLAGQHRLGDKTAAAGFGGLRPRSCVARACDKHDRSKAVHSRGVKLGTGGEPFHAGHSHVEEDQVIASLARQSERRFAALRAVGPAKHQLQRHRNGPASDGVIIHHHEADGWLSEVRVRSRATEFVQDIQRAGGGLEGGRSAQLRAVEELLEHRFEGGSEAKRRARSSSTALSCAL